MKKITTLFIFLFLALSCKVSNKIDADIANIKKIEIIQCYSLEEIFNGFIIFNEIVKQDSLMFNLHRNSVNALMKKVDEDNGSYPLFMIFKPYGYFDGQSMVYIKSSFLGVIRNSNRNILLSQLSDTLIKNGFPNNINFFYIPSPFIDTMSILIGSKTKNYLEDLKIEDLSAFGFQKIKSYNLKGKPVEESDNDKSFIPFIVFKETSKGLFLSGEYLLKLTLKDTIVYKSLDRFDLKNDTILLDALYTRKYIKDKIK
jgi:hypothetical protein